MCLCTCRMTRRPWVQFNRSERADPWSEYAGARMRTVSVVMETRQWRRLGADISVSENLRRNSKQSNGASNEDIGWFFYWKHNLNFLWTGRFQCWENCSQRRLFFTRALLDRTLLLDTLPLWPETPPFILERFFHRFIQPTENCVWWFNGATYKLTVVHLIHSNSMIAFIKFWCIKIDVNRININYYRNRRKYTLKTIYHVIYLIQNSIVSPEEKCGLRWNLARENFMSNFIRVNYAVNLLFMSMFWRRYNIFEGAIIVMSCSPWIRKVM